MSQDSAGHPRMAATPPPDEERQPRGSLCAGLAGLARTAFTENVQPPHYPDYTLYSCSCMSASALERRIMTHTATRVVV